MIIRVKTLAPLHIFTAILSWWLYKSLRLELTRRVKTVIDQLRFYFFRLPSFSTAHYSSESETHFRFYVFLFRFEKMDFNGNLTQPNQTQTEFFHLQNLGKARNNYFINFFVFFKDNLTILLLSLVNQLRTFQNYWTFFNKFLKIWLKYFLFLQKISICQL